MNQNISTPWAVAAIVAVVVIIGVFVWRSHNSGPVVQNGPISPYQEYRGSPGGPGGPPAGVPR
jgi:hypothetical protein